MSDIYDTLHPEGNLSDNLYPNIKSPNIPKRAVTFSQLSNAVVDAIKGILVPKDISNEFSYQSRYIDKVTGNANPDPNSNCTDYIEVADYVKFLITGYAQYATCLFGTYDKNKQLIRVYGEGTSAGVTFTDFEYTPQDDEVYVRFSTYQYTTHPLIIKSYEPYNIGAPNELLGKKYVACGDSFTRGDATPATSCYPYLISQRNNMTLVNMSANGTYIHNGSDGFTNPAKTYYYQNIPADADFITIAYGLNEISTPKGDKTSSDNTTIWGAWNEVLGWLTANRPHAKIGIISNDAWITYEFRNLLQEIAAYWGVAFLDLKEYGKPMLISGKFTEDGDVSSVAKNARTTQYCISSQNGHPNVEGQLVRSWIIEDFLRGMNSTANKYTKKEIKTLLNTKQDVLTFDDVPTEDSDNPVKSKGIKSYIDKYAWYASEGTPKSSISFSNTNPYKVSKAKMKQLGDMSYKSENLIVLNDVAETERFSFKYKVSNGKFYIKKFVDDSTSSNAIINLAQPITFIANKTYYLNQFNTNNVLSIRFLDNDNTPIVTLGIIANATFTPTETKVATKIQWFGSGEYNVELVYSPMITENSVTEFKQGFTGIRDSAVTSVVSKGSNLFGEDIEQGGFNADGTRANYTSRVRNVNYFSLPVGTYTLIAFANVSVKLVFSAFNSSNAKILDTGATTNPKTFTLTENVTKCCVQVASYDLSSNLTPSDVTGVMLVKGSIAPTEYKPYVTPIIKNIPSQIQALGGYGWGINDTCYNYIDFVNKKFVQKVGRVDLGSLTYFYDSANNRFTVTIDNIKNVLQTEVPNAMCCCYYILAFNTIIANPTRNLVIGFNTSGVMTIKNFAYTDATQFKTAMSGIYLYYELATPVETDISAYLTTDTIDVEPLGTLEFTNTYSQEVPNESSYLFNAVTLNNVVDSNGNPRFIEGNGTPISQTGVSITYCKWSLSGTHLILCVAGTFESGTTVAANVNVGSFPVPKFAYDKVTTLFLNFVDRKSFAIYDSSYQGQTVVINLVKSGDNVRIQPGASFTTNSKKNFRFQFDLLIDQS